MTDLYNRDYMLWVQEQKKLLASRRFDELDLDNLLEEVADMGKSEPRAFKRHLIQLLTHLLKWDFQQNQMNDLREIDHWFRSWLDTVQIQRYSAVSVLADNPSLKPRIQGIYNEAYQQARILAAKGLNSYIDARHFTIKDFPEDCPWTFEQVIEEDFLPAERPG
jgi:hypothetical protein